MAKPRPRGKPPSRRDGASPRPPSAAATGGPPASELAAKMQGIADQIDRLPHDLAREIAGDSAKGPAPSASGSEVEDRGLVGPRGRATTAQVVTLDAYPHPDRPGCLLIRLDGWDGHLSLTLTRDRASLLATRLAQAVETSRAWYDPRE